MTRRYPVLASPEEFASYVALGGDVTPESQCIEVANLSASARFPSLKTPNTDLSWGWIVGFAMALGIASFPIFTPFLTFIVAAAVATVGLLGAAIQLRPMLGALNTRHAVSWTGSFVTTEDQLFHVPLDPQSYEESIAQLRHFVEHESEERTSLQISPVRSSASALVSVGFGPRNDEPGQLGALDSLDGLSMEMRGRLFRRRRYAFQWLARSILPDVFVQAASLTLITVAAGLSVALEGTQTGWGVLLPRLAQLGVGLAMGRSASSSWHTLAWWRVTRQDWARCALEERLVVAAVAGVPNPVVSELAENGRAIGRSFATPEEYARLRRVAPLSPTVIATSTQPVEYSQVEAVSQLFEGDASENKKPNPIESARLHAQNFFKTKEYSDSSALLRRFTPLTNAAELLGEIADSSPMGLTVSNADEHTKAKYADAFLEELWSLRDKAEARGQFVRVSPFQNTPNKSARRPK